MLSCRISAGVWLPLAVCVSLCAGCSHLMATTQNAEGQRLVWQGNYPAAIAQFQQAAYNNPRDPQPFYNMAVAYHELGTRQGRTELLTQAENCYRQCLDRNRDHVAAHRGLAVLLVEENRNAEAFQLLEQWAASSPSLADARVELGRLYNDTQQRDKAQAHLQAALSIDPRSPSAMAALGQLHEQAGDYAQALTDYTRSLEYDQFQPEVAQRLNALRANSTYPAPPAPRVVDRPTPGFRY